jgi:hypothetical protein
MKQESKRLYSLMIAGLILVAALLTYFELIVPAYGNLETVKGQEQSETTLYSNEKQIVSTAQSLLAAYQADASSSQSIALALPVGPDVAGALAQTYGIAANTGMTINGTAVVIQAVQATVPTAASVGSQIGNAAATGSIVKPTGTVSLQLNATGSYEALKAFLQGMETNIRLFDVSAISIQPVANFAVTTKSQPANPDMFNYTITVVTYYQAP